LMPGLGWRLPGMLAQASGEAKRDGRPERDRLWRARSIICLASNFIGLNGIA